MMWKCEIASRYYNFTFWICFLLNKIQNININLTKTSKDYGRLTTLNYLSLDQLPSVGVAISNATCDRWTTNFDAML